MSTRANIIIRDKYDELIFYRHSDGYPEGTLPTLEKFLDWAIEGRIRDNVGQAAGWLILIGADEYGVTAVNPVEPVEREGMGWKCGAYEPSVGIHGDIEHLYVIDLEEMEIHQDGKEGYVYNGKYGAWKRPSWLMEEELG